MLKKPLGFINLFAFNKKRQKPVCIILIYFITIFIFCEFLIYYLVELKCSWPKVHTKNEVVDDKPIKAMILADIHMLGPRRGHWFDKLRREWRMHRSFQTAITLFHPEIIFILGDLFDEGQWVNDKEFQEYISRFQRLFYVPESTKLIGIVGNHDIGFHYRMHPYFTERFKENFNNTGVSLLTFRNVHFITINSMAMENDKCYFCEASIEELKRVSRILKCAKEPLTCKKSEEMEIVYSQPIILQHFPTYRSSDEVCIEHDSPIIETYREKWEVLSKEATDLLGILLNPRLAFSGHSHHFCRLKNRLGIEEFTIASFSYRNKNNPSFLLAQFTPSEYSIYVCMLPYESTITLIYVIGLVFPIIVKIVLITHAYIEHFQLHLPLGSF